jgi:hypothetical protein
MRTAFAKIALAGSLLFGAHMAAQATALGTLTGTTTISGSTTQGSFADVFSFTPFQSAYAGMTVTSVTFSTLYGVTLSGLALYEGIFTSASQTAGLTPVSIGMVFGTISSGKATIITLANSATVSAIGYTLVVSGTSIGHAAYGGAIALMERPADIPPVPEPETYAMLLAGVGMMGFIARRRKKAF